MPSFDDKFVIYNMKYEYENFTGRSSTDFSFEKTLADGTEVQFFGEEFLERVQLMKSVPDTEKDGAGESYTIDTFRVDHIGVNIHVIVRHTTYRKALLAKIESIMIKCFGPEATGGNYDLEVGQSFVYDGEGPNGEDIIGISAKIFPIITYKPEVWQDERWDFDHAEIVGKHPLPKTTDVQKALDKAAAMIDILID